MLRTALLAIRPKTLAASIAPVVIGGSMGGLEHLPSLFACLLFALLIQVGTNLTNDYCDFFKGADTEERIGPTRVMQAGLVNAETLQKAITAVFLAAFVVGFFLTLRGGWQMMLITILSITSGILYTAGPLSLGYLGLGDLFVLIFFGPVAVAGTYYLQRLEISYEAIANGFAVGLISTAILAVNNLRDIEGDAKCGKRTLAVRFGRGFVRMEYLACFVIACAIPFYVSTSLLPALTLLFAIPTIRTVFTTRDGPALNNALTVTGKLLLLYTILFSIGIYLK